MAFWSADLTTEDGARGATGLASMASFVAGGLSVLGAVLAWGILNANPAALLLLASCVIEATWFVISGFRFRAGKGFFWGIGAAVLLVLEILAKLSAVSFVGIMINVVLLIVVVNGVRGARALRRGFADSDGLADVFR